MRGFFAFTKKEFTEQLRSGKALILFAVLLLFGMTSPLLAKMMPEMLRQFAVKGMEITMPKPTLIDAWAQFFKNMNELGLIVLLLLFSGLLSHEFSRGTLVIPLSKGIPRGVVLISKFISAVVTWTIGLALSALTACGYTAYLFGSFAKPRLFFSLLCLWLFGVFLLALLLLGSTVTSGFYGGLLLTAAVTGMLLILNILPRLACVNPVTLLSKNTQVLTAASAAGQMTTAAWVTAGCSGLCLAGAIFCFAKRKV